MKRERRQTKVASTTMTDRSGDEKAKEEKTEEPPPTKSPDVPVCESRLGKSHLSSPSKPKTSSTSSDNPTSAKKTLALRPKAKVKNGSSDATNSSTEEDGRRGATNHTGASSESTTAPVPVLISFTTLIQPTNTAKPPTNASRSTATTSRLTDAPNLMLPTGPAEQPINITINTIMAAAKSVVVQALPTSSVAFLKSKVRQKMKTRSFALYHNDKELAPDDSTLESLGITKSCSVRLHVKTQSGTSDNEDIKSLLRLSKSLHDLKSIISTIPAPQTVSRAKSVTRTPRNEHAAADMARQEEEHKRTREKMAKLRAEMARRSGRKPEEENTAKKKKKRKSRRDGGVAGEHAIASSSSASAETVKSGEESSDRDKPRPVPTVAPEHVSVFEPCVEKGQGVVTSKELMLYFDPPESVARAQACQTDLHEPPETREKLLKLKEELQKSRCAFCHLRLPLALREMPCRCTKVYCRNHRSPQCHHCAVDLKTVDRIRLQSDVPSASAPAGKKGGPEEDIVNVKGARKRLPPPSR